MHRFLSAVLCLRLSISRSPAPASACIRTACAAHLRQPACRVQPAQNYARLIVSYHHRRPHWLRGREQLKKRLDRRLPHVASAQATCAQRRQLHLHRGRWITAKMVALCDCGRMNQMGNVEHAQGLSTDNLVHSSLASKAEHRPCASTAPLRCSTPRAQAGPTHRMQGGLAKRSKSTQMKAAAHALRAPGAECAMSSQSKSFRVTARCFRDARCLPAPARLSSEPAACAPSSAPAARQRTALSKDEGARIR